jgi:hypothetical protein
LTLFDGLREPMTKVNFCFIRPTGFLQSADSGGFGLGRVVGSQARKVFGRWRVLAPSVRLAHPLDSVVLGCGARARRLADRPFALDNPASKPEHRLRLVGMAGASCEPMLGDKTRKLSVD